MPIMEKWLPRGASSCRVSGGSAAFLPALFWTEDRASFSALSCTQIKFNTARSCFCPEPTLPSHLMLPTLLPALLPAPHSPAQLAPLLLSLAVTILSCHRLPQTLSFFPLRHQGFCFLAKNSSKLISIAFFSCCCPFAVRSKSYKSGLWKGVCKQGKHCLQKKVNNQMAEAVQMWQSCADAALRIFIKFLWLVRQMEEDIVLFITERK